MLNFDVDVNAIWNTHLKGFEGIQPPRDGDMFFINGIHTSYGRDFMNWYQGSLEQHFIKVVNAAQVLRETFKTAEICQTLSGIHWLRHHPRMPNAAEYCAGYYNYERLIDVYKDLKVSLIFTCLEMNDYKKHEHPEYSAPRELAHKLAEMANSKRVKLHGENALPMCCNYHNYCNISDILLKYNFDCFTFLRINYLVDKHGEPTEEMNCFRKLIDYVRMVGKKF